VSEKRIPERMLLVCSPFIMLLWHQSVLEMENTLAREMTCWEPHLLLIQSSTDRVEVELLFLSGLRERMNKLESWTITSVEPSCGIPVNKISCHIELRPPASFRLISLPNPDFTTMSWGPIISRLTKED